MIDPVVLAFDTGVGAGLGHQRRMEAVASALWGLGVSSRLVDAADGAEGQIVLVDSYRWRADDQSRFSAGRLAGMDDLDRALQVDVLINPCPGAKRRRGVRVHLAGTRFAPIDPRFANLAPAPPADPVRELLVATGGADVCGSGAALADDLHAALGPALRIRYALGPWSADSTPAGAEIVETAAGLGADLARADLVVTAAGVTMLESLCLGRPTVAIVLFENQRRQAEGAAAARAVVVARLNDAVGVAQRLSQDREWRVRLGAAGRRLVDGKGARRIAEVLVGTS